ncbi:ATP-binding protein [Candidatus Berkiella aquae]|uniref:Archaeal ATPase n=1 Tax=Candidatus Berkiella aquae TaxID=295108 RepID=A0A0Q9YMV7_9GAMM|nr:ATP-binding protein [Candidatus Berkiella aquae]MCS5712849.1 hypothetical protein [Candidatus Berkiella aquae]
MRLRDYFPLGLAKGDAFCNRENETELLVDNLKNGKHTLLVATRRYGKSSLALHAIKLSGLPYVEIDFYMASNEKAVEKYILDGVVDLIGKSFGSVDKIINSIKRYLKNLKPKLDIGPSAFKLELAVDNAVDPATNVKEALLLLEKLLEEKGMQAVMLMDEFQSVGSIAKGSGIEAAIRHVAQKTKHLTILFSGSNRKLLTTMFEDENRPLYKLCWKMQLKRIDQKHYHDHLQKAAISAWKNRLEDEILNEILSITERHPFYVNKLCDRVWSLNKKSPPSLLAVSQAWIEIIEEEKSDAIKDILQLSAGQKAVLTQIAKGAAQLTNKKTILRLEMSSSSIITAIEGLEEKDIIEKQGNKYQVINPVLKHFVLKSSTEEL